MWELGGSFGSLGHSVDGVGNNVGGMDVEKWEDGEWEESKVGGGHVGAGMELSPPICRLTAAPPGLGRRFPTHSKYSQFRGLQIFSFLNA